jgi:hypothetical protein
MTDTLQWKPDWPACQENLIRWWNHQGMAMCLEVIRDERREDIPMPALPADLEYRWTNAAYRCSAAEGVMAGVDYWAEAFPYFDTQIGPGSLGTFLGSKPHFVVDTVWYDPCIADPERSGPIEFCDGQHWFDVHMALVDEGLRRAMGRYLVGIPDLIENLDTLAALRGDGNLLFDVVDRPGWVLERMEEINAAYFQVFDLFYQKVAAADGGNAFSAFRVWGPGKTAKIQCDFSASLSPQMFRRFAQPFLKAQCEFLDYSLYHLDGTNARQHVEPLLEIGALDAIEWTPQAGKPGGGDPCWYELYWRILAGGKSIQAVGVRPEEVVPLVDAVGPAGVFVIVDAPVDRRTAERLTRELEPYRK